MAREKTWQFDHNRPYVPSSALDMGKYVLWYWKAFLTGQIGSCWTVLATAITAATPSTTGGTLAAGTYYYQVVAINGGNASAPSNEVPAVTTGATGSVALSWSAVAGATDYRVYRGTAPATMTAYFSTGGATSFTDTGAAGTAGAPTTTGTWQVVGSSDGSTGAMDGLDRWTTTYTPGKLNGNTAGSARSWTVLRCTALVNGHIAYVLFDFASTLGYQVAVSYGHTNAPVGGSITLSPALSSPAAGALSTFTSATQANIHLYGALAIDGSFNLLHSRDYSQKFIGGCVFNVLANAKAATVFPVLMSQAAESGTQTYGTGYCILGSSFSLDYNGAAWARYPDDNGSGSFGVIVPATANVPDHPDAFDGTYADWPVWVGSKTAGQVTVIGRMGDIYVFPQTITTGTVQQGGVDNVATPQYMLVGNFWFPTNVAPVV